MLCHGLPQPEALLRVVFHSTAPRGVVSVMALNAATLAVRSTLDQRWADALASFDATGAVGVLGIDTREGTCRGAVSPLEQDGIVPQAWYDV